MFDAAVNSLIRRRRSFRFQRVYSYHFDNPARKLRYSGTPYLRSNTMDPAISENDLHISSELMKTNKSKPGYFKKEMWYTLNGSSQGPATRLRSISTIILRRRRKTRETEMTGLIYGVFIGEAAGWAH